MSRDIIDINSFRERLEARREESVEPIRDSFMEEMGELLADFIDAVGEATGGDRDKMLEEVMAACATVLALAAEEQFTDLDDQAEFIDSVAEIATELLEGDEQQGKLFDDEP